MRRCVPLLIPGLTLTLSLAACGSQAASHVTASTAMTAAPTRTAAAIAAPSRTVTPTVTTTAPVTTRGAAPAPAVATATITAPDSGGTGLTSASVGTTQCTAADLRAAAVAPNGAAGTMVLGFTLTNRSAVPCRTGGFPGVAFLDAAGRVADTQTVRTTNDMLGQTPVRAFSIAPGQAASFRVVVGDVASSGGACPSFPAIQIIAPNDTATQALRLPGGAVFVCGRAAVSALEPGATATGQ